QAVALQQIAARAPPRQAIDSPPVKDTQQLLRAPARMRPPQREQLLHHGKRRRRRAAVWPPRAIHQTLRPIRLVPRQPLVTNSSAHTVACAQLAESRETPVVVGDE